MVSSFNIYIYSVLNYYFFSFCGDADLQGASFKGANVQKANFDGANLQGSDLTTAKNLTLQQIESAIGDRTTRLPDDMQAPSHWQ
ncbi:pentapeptide repeat-containing protein [Nostoc sp. 106C]|uniref:pentapeptide repeat-containing protein n=1 Tax=Nostoc sp. 106C TaxID=1932667 RepID=UPI000A3A1313|nr:pentapeptide repeat-containing protein [Nostoc sp. 106C]OUL24286.1 hypothetical protein BV375_24030 [Nostoc sp. 106C]